MATLKKTRKNLAHLGGHLYQPLQEIIIFSSRNETTDLQFSSEQ